MINADRRILWSPGGPHYSISAVAQDGDGQILFMHCRQPVEAYAFAQQVLHLPLNVRTVMVSYIPEDKLLVSNDIFGQNIASSARFVDDFGDDGEYLRRAKEYYYNIVLPYSPIVLKTLPVVEKLDIDMPPLMPPAQSRCKYITAPSGFAAPRRMSAAHLCSLGTLVYRKIVRGH